jgi:hypothetical protein
MKRFATLAGLAVILTTSACFFDDDHFGPCENGQGERVTRELNLPDFTAIDLRIDAQVYIEQGDEQFVEVRAQRNIIDLLNRDVRDGEWEIEFDQCAFDFSTVEIWITVKDLDRVGNSASGDIEGLSLFNLSTLDVFVSGSGDISLTVDAFDLDIRNSGSGDIEIDVQASDVSARISGSGDVELYGFTDDLSVTVSGSGDFEGFGLEAQTADLTISGSGFIECWVTDYLDVFISGSGNVYYKGFPAIDVNITGSGDLINAN